MNPLITVLTPTYNREKELQKLYRSLQMQTNRAFIWLVVDDGSQDDTECVIKRIQETSDLNIQYIKQENKGKHIALNTGIAQISTKYTFIVDSDDVLTADAIEQFYADLQYFDDDDTICGVGYLRGFSDNEPIGNIYPKDYEISDFISVRVNQNIDGDKAEIWKTADIRTIPYPEITGEKFFGESYVWFRLALQKKMLFVNKIIYITEYLEGGLSKSGRALRIRCPRGGMMNAEVMMHKPFNLKSRIKGGLLYTAYGRFAHLKCTEMLNGTSEKTLMLLCYLPGYFVYRCWKKYL